MELEQTQRGAVGIGVPRIAMLLGAMVSVLSLGGCGGSEAGSNAARISPAEAAFITAAEPICKRLNKEIKVTEQKGFHLSLIARLSPPHAAAELRAVNELAALTPPAAMARAWQQLLAYRHTLQRELVTFGREAKAGNVAAIKALSASKERVHRELLAAARRDGFRACALVG